MKRILVVDDDPIIVEVIAEILNQYVEDCMVMTADSGKYAENLILKTISRPDLILLDIQLGSEDGREICRKFKNQIQTRDIPIILISAQPWAGERASQYGANDFVPKPFDIDQLLTKVDTYINH